MGMIKQSLLVLLVGIFLNACASEVPELKSPCVGIKGNPCDKRPVELNNYA